MRNIQDLVGKEVEVYANGVRYIGTLIEVSDEEVHIKTSLQWLALPASSVSEVKLKDSYHREPEREGHGDVQE